MKKIISILFFVFAFVGISQAEEFKSIKDFSYKSIGFASSEEDLTGKGLSCKDGFCSNVTNSYVHDFGFLSGDITVFNGVETTFHENRIIKFRIGQIIPYSGEGCKPIMEDIQKRINKKYSSNLDFAIVKGRFPYTDDGTLLGKAILGEDILKLDFICRLVKDEKGHKNQIFILGAFTYENLASRILADDI